MGQTSSNPGCQSFESSNSIGESARISFSKTHQDLPRARSRNGTHGETEQVERISKYGCGAKVKSQVTAGVWSTFPFRGSMTNFRSRLQPVAGLGCVVQREAFGPSRWLPWLQLSRVQLLPGPGSRSAPGARLGGQGEVPCLASTRSSSALSHPFFGGG